jgi:hypothetical protein
LTDGLLDSRRDKARTLGLKLLYANGPVAALALLVLATGGGIVAAVAAGFGFLISLSIVTSVRTPRAALRAGMTVAVGLLLCLLAVAWLVSHPIL